MTQITTGKCGHLPGSRHSGVWSKGGLGSITMSKASGGSPAELFQIPKDDAVKVLYLICQQIWKTQQWTQDWKKSVFIPISKKGNAKECSNYHTIALILHANKVMLKILQARLQEYVNWKHPDVQARFKKGRGITDQVFKIHWVIEKAREFQNKHLLLLHWLCKSLLLDHNKLWNLLKQMERGLKETLPVFRETCS